MTARLLLLAALGLSTLSLAACSEPRTVDLGATNLTSLRVASVEFRADGVTIGTIGPIEPGMATLWQPAPAPDRDTVEAHVKLKNGREVTLPALAIGDADDAWIHVRILADGLEVETAGQPPILTPLDAPYGRLRAPADTTDAAPDSLVAPPVL